MTSTSPKSDTGALLEQIYERLDITTALPELDPRQVSQAYNMLCPSCGKRRAFVYKGGHVITCNRRNDCGYQASLWDYVATRDGLSEGRDVLKALADMAAFSLPTTLSPEGLESLKRAQKHQSKLEAAQGILTARLFSSEGAKELEYLHGRGYSDEDIQRMGLGCVPPKSALTEQLKDAIDDQDATVTELSVVGFGDTHTISIPFRNRRGQLIGWSVRALDPKEGESKYKYSKGMDTGAELFNLDQCRGVKDLIIVEAPIDALVATARGMAGVVACGRDKPTDKQLDGLKGTDLVSVTLALDNDEAGRKGTLDTLYRLADRHIANYVVDYPPMTKDLDEFIKTYGASEAGQLINEAPAGYRYLIEQIFSPHRDVMNDRERRDVVNQLIDLDARLNDDLASQAIVSTLTDRLELPPEMIRQAMKDHRESQQQRKREQGYRQLQVKASQLVKDGKFTDLEELYEEQLPSLRAKNISAIVEPYTSDHFVSDISHRNEGLSTGFGELDEYATLPTEALTVIAGRPSHGKTTVMLNMLYNLVHNYSDKSFYFFSYEETRSQLALKLITLMAGIEVDQYKNTQTIERYFKTGQLDESYLPPQVTGIMARARLDRAKEDYDHLIRTGRLWIVDEPLDISDLSATIQEVAENRSNVGAVFVDYIQKIKNKNSNPTRQVAIQQVSGELLDAAKRAGVAVVVGAQLNRNAERSDGRNISLDQIRESGDIEQDAHLVLSLYNEARGQYDANPEESIAPKRTTNIEVKILKNRSGVTNKTTTLVFEAPILRLKSSKTIDNQY